MKKTTIIAATLLCTMILGQGIPVGAEDFSDAEVNIQQEEQDSQEDLIRMSLDEAKEIAGWKAVSDEKTALKDGEICSYPSLRDGEPVKEIKAGDTIKRLGTIYDAWSCVTYSDEDGTEQTGYLLTDILEGTVEAVENQADEDLSQEAMIGESTDIGVFAEASEIEAKAGDIVTAAPGTNLKPLGKYRISHYCPCSICCGPWTNGITSTGVTAVTNRTIAVDPRVIPYGCSIVINGQVYVAEDCGGAIKGNRIDIYVATHEEAMEKGVYYTDIYLVQ